MKTKKMIGMKSRLHEADEVGILSAGANDKWKQIKLPEIKKKLAEKEKLLKDKKVILK